MEYPLRHHNRAECISRTMQARATRLWIRAHQKGSPYVLSFFGIPHNYNWSIWIIWIWSLMIINDSCFINCCELPRQWTSWCFEFPSPDMPARSPALQVLWSKPSRVQRWVACFQMKSRLRWSPWSNTVPNRSRVRDFVGWTKVCWAL